MYWSTHQQKGECSEKRLSSAQWQLLVDSLHPVSEILYGGTYGAGFRVRTTDGHLPNGGGDSVHVCFACNLILYNAAGT